MTAAAAPLVGRAVGPVVAPPDHATAIKPWIGITPFSAAALDRADAYAVGREAEVAAALRAHVGRDYVFATGGRHALDLVLADLALDPDDVVTITTTSGSNYVSGCVTQTIGRHCRWSMRREPRTRAVIAIHEWGRPCRQARELAGGDVPLIEDCAYAFASRFPDGTPVGTVGDYAIFSLGKMFAVNFGGLAVGLRREPAGAASAMTPAQRDYVLARVGPELARLPEVCGARVRVWRALAGRFAEAGAAPFFQIADGVVPSVFMFGVDPQRVSPDAVKQRYHAHGVESSVFYGSDAVFIPCHQMLGAGSVEFLFQLYRDLLDEADRARAGTPAAVGGGGDGAC